MRSKLVAFHTNSKLKSTVVSSGMSDFTISRHTCGHGKEGERGVMARQDGLSGH